jgi:membrane protease YdiL (CAAX protease family)
MVAVSLAIALPLVLLTALLIQRRPAGTVSSVAGRVRWRWLGLCLLLALAGTALLFGLDLVAATTLGEDVDSSGGTGTWVGLPAFLATTAMLLALVPLQAAAEEYIFRGWLLQAVGAYLSGPWIPISVQALLFAAVHGWGTIGGFAALIVFGTATGWLAVRTGGLEAGVAVHVVTNVASFALLAAFDQLAVGQTLTDAPWHTAILDAVIVCLYAAAVMRLARRRSLPTTAPARPLWPPSQPQHPPHPPPSPLPTHRQTDVPH